MAKKGHLFAPPVYLPTIGGKAIYKRQKAEHFKMPDFQSRVFGTTFSSLSTKPSCMKQKGVTKQKGTKSLKDRVHKHLNDKNDVITEEDIKNIKVGEDTVEDPEASESADKLADAIREKKQTSPWTILSEEDK